MGILGTRGVTEMTAFGNASVSTNQPHGESAISLVLGLALVHGPSARLQIDGPAANWLLVLGDVPLKCGLHLAHNLRIDEPRHFLENRLRLGWERRGLAGSLRDA